MRIEARFQRRFSHAIMLVKIEVVTLRIEAVTVKTEANYGGISPDFFADCEEPIQMEK